MGITAEQIQENWKQFITYIDFYISEPRKTKLKEFYLKYEDRFILMPASHKLAYHNCFPGGYIDHVNRVIEGAIKINNVWGSFGNLTHTEEEVVFSALNHDLGKFGDFENEAVVENDSEWHKKNLGEIYKFNTKLSYMTVPDRSIYLLNQLGIELSKNEWLSIKLHDGLYDETNKPYLLSYMPETKLRTNLPYIIHQADLMAARIEFEKEWLIKLGNEPTSKDNKIKNPTGVKLGPNKFKPNPKLDDGFKSILNGIFENGD